ncbi:MAG TPA: hypothetical protein ENN12_00250 [Epsilonproteobacteria bacterium]|nr:hypothetical protein [Campylobacterota bacterium]
MKQKGKDKLISRELYSKELNRLTASKILSIAALNGAVEIKYLKNGDVEHLSFTTFSSPSWDLTTRECSFVFKEEELPKTMLAAQDFIYDSTETIYTKEPHEVLGEIAYIHDTSYNLLYHYDPDGRCEEITIIAHTKGGQLKRYILGFESNSDGIRVDLSITSEEISKVFISKSLNEQNLVIYSSFDDRYIYTRKTVDTIGENGEISRLHSSSWIEVYQRNKKESIDLREHEDYFYISALGLWGDRFAILKKEHFNLMDDEDQKRFCAYSDALVRHLKTLFINKNFAHIKRYEFSDDEDCQKLLDSFKQKGYEVEQVYIEASENGWPPSLFIHKASKGGIEIKIVTHNDWGMEEFVVDVEYDGKFEDK